MQERKEASQKQNKRLKSQANLQNRRKQEKLQAERRKKDLLAITFQREVPRLGLGRMAGGSGSGRHLQPSESSDNLQQVQRPDTSQRHLAKVHSDQAEGRREAAERIEKVEQTTVHTVITRQEKLHHSQGQARHLPALATTADQPAVHGAGRAGSLSGSDNGREHPRHRHSEGGGGGGGGGVPHLRSLVRADPLESRAGEGS